MFGENRAGCEDPETGLVKLKAFEARSERAHRCDTDLGGARSARNVRLVSNVRENEGRCGGAVVIYDGGSRWRFLARHSRISFFFFKRSAAMVRRRYGIRFHGITRSGF